MATEGPIHKKALPDLPVMRKSVARCGLALHNKPMHIPEHIAVNVPLQDKTTLEVGGPAEYFLDATSLDQALSGLTWAKQAGVPITILGGGSNVLIADEGLSGLVIRIGLSDWSSTIDSQSVIVKAGAGLNWDKLVRTVTDNGWAGIECLVGIPGRVGAAPIQNIGAYGQEFADVAVGVHVVDLRTLQPSYLNAKACCFGYRTSIFKTVEQGRYLVTGVTLALQRNGAPVIRYDQLRSRLNADADIGHVMKTVEDLRAEKSMLAGGMDQNRRSAGSFFLNPILSPDALEALKVRLTQHALDSSQLPVWHASMANGAAGYKVPAAWLIERAGLHKGYGAGPVGLSTNHTLAIVNRGHGTASDIIKFAQHVQESVSGFFGIKLRPEPVLLGIHTDAL